MVRNQCFVRMPESEFAKTTLNGLHFKTKDHFRKDIFQICLIWEFELLNTSNCGKVTKMIGHTGAESKIGEEGRGKMSPLKKRTRLMISRIILVKVGIRPMKSKFTRLRWKQLSAI